MCTGRQHQKYSDYNKFYVLKNECLLHSIWYCDIKQVKRQNTLVQSKAELDLSHINKGPLHALINSNDFGILAFNK